MSSTLPVNREVDQAKFLLPEAMRSVLPDEITNESTIPMNRPIHPPLLPSVVFLIVLLFHLPQSFSLCLSGSASSRQPNNGSRSMTFLGATHWSRRVCPAGYSRAVRSRLPAQRNDAGAASVKTFWIQDGRSPPLHAHANYDAWRHRRIHALWPERGASTAVVTTSMSW